MMECMKCRKACGIGLVILGLAFRTRDLGLWDFWNTQW